MNSYIFRFLGASVMAFVTGITLAAFGAVVGAILGATLGAIVGFAIGTELGDAILFGTGFFGLAGTIPSMIRDDKDTDSDTGGCLVVAMVVGALIIGSHFKSDVSNNVAQVIALLTGAIVTAGSISAFMSLRQGKKTTKTIDINKDVSRNGSLKKNVSEYNDARISSPNRLNVSIHNYRSLPKLEEPAGYVYVIQETEFSKRYKIGRTIHPKRRAYQIDIKTPGDIRVVALLKSDKAKVLERRLHQKYASKRKRGEWFDLTDAQVQEIRNM